jgi:hypothetical protein
MAEVFYSKAFALPMSVCSSAQWWKNSLDKGLSVMNELSDEAKKWMNEYNCFGPRRCTLKTKYIRDSTLPLRSNDWNPYRDWNNQAQPMTGSGSCDQMTETLIGIETHRDLGKRTAI